mmetsp:Transcript_125303/g.348650  ORF Transcript_125303/g.348650 Transcript_125303/m.348650 type:complete len:213 (-) Transcript_125303:980-1618(-)
MHKPKPSGVCPCGSDKALTAGQAGLVAHLRHACSVREVLGHRGHTVHTAPLLVDHAAVDLVNAVELWILLYPRCVDVNLRGEVLGGKDGLAEGRQPAESGPDHQGFGFLWRALGHRQEQARCHQGAERVGHVRDEAAPIVQGPAEWGRQCARCTVQRTLQAKQSTQLALGTTLPSQVHEAQPKQAAEEADCIAKDIRCPVDPWKDDEGQDHD